MASRRVVASTDDVPADTTYLFTIRETGSGTERDAILVRTDDELCAWLNYCQHYTDIPIDKGSGATMRGKRPHL